VVAPRSKEDGGPAVVLFPKPEMSRGPRVEPRGVRRRALDAQSPSRPPTEKIEARGRTGRAGAVESSVRRASAANWRRGGRIVKSAEDNCLGNRQGGTRTGRSLATRGTAKMDDGPRISRSGQRLPAFLRGRDRLALPDRPKICWGIGGAARGTGTRELREKSRESAGPDGVALVWRRDLRVECGERPDAPAAPPKNRAGIRC